MKLLNTAKTLTALATILLTQSLLANNPDHYTVEPEFLPTAQERSHGQDNLNNFYTVASRDLNSNNTLSTISIEEPKTSSQFDLAFSNKWEQIHHLEKTNKEQLSLENNLRDELASLVYQDLTGTKTTNAYKKVFNQKFSSVWRKLQRVQEQNQKTISQEKNLRNKLASLVMEKSLNNTPEAVLVAKADAKPTFNKVWNQLHASNSSDTQKTSLRTQLASMVEQSIHG